MVGSLALQNNSLPGLGLASASLRSLFPRTQSSLRRWLPALPGVRAPDMATLQVTNIPHFISQDEFSRLFLQLAGCLGCRMLKTESGT